MFIAKGRRVSFEMEGGRPVRCPASSSILHDPDGTVWPANSVLIARFARLGEKLEDPSDEVAAFQAGTVARKGSVDLPKRTLDGWRNLGQPVRIMYTRDGEYADDYEHNFNETLDIRQIFGSEVILFQRQRVYRLELPALMEYNWRGFCWP